MKIRLADSEDLLKKQLTFILYYCILLLLKTTITDLKQKRFY